MHNMRRGHDGAFKAKIALEAVKGEKTLARLSSEFGVHANQIRHWRKQLLEELPRLFSNRRTKEDRDREGLLSELYQKIGQPEVELDWLEKNLRSSTEEKRKLVETGYAMITVSRQCELLGLSRSAYYYRSQREDRYNLQLTNLLDEHFTRRPFYEVDRMVAWLNRQ